MSQRSRANEAIELEIRPNSLLATSIDDVRSLSSAGDIEDEDRAEIDPYTSEEERAVVRKLDRRLVLFLALLYLLSFVDRSSKIQAILPLERRTDFW